MPAKQPKQRKRIRVYIVDDHPVVRQGIAQLLDQEPDLTVCGEAEEAHGVLEAFKARRPDLAIVDLSLKGSDGFSLLKDLKARAPKVPVLVLSMHDESIYAERVLRVGARGYIMKEAAPAELVSAIRRVLSGEIYLSRKMGSKILERVAGGRDSEARSSLEALSDRELQVFRMIGRGLSTRQIAGQLHLSVKTIESHREHIKAKLGLENSTELVQQAALIRAWGKP